MVAYVNCVLKVNANELFLIKLMKTKMALIYKLTVSYKFCILWLNLMLFFIHGCLLRSHITGRSDDILISCIGRSGNL